MTDYMFFTNSFVALQSHLTPCIHSPTQVNQILAFSSLRQTIREVISVILYLRYKELEIRV